jgi:hypothetical protein
MLLLLTPKPWAASTGSTLVLKTAWAKKFRNRLSIEAKVTVLKLSSKEDDADIHGGSKQNQIGLPMVAEILNGAEPSQKTARQELQPAGNADKTIYGAWRLWFEHPPHGGGTQCQNFGTQAPDICQDQALTGSDSNPDHSFEIHPVFSVNGASVGRSSMILKDNLQVKDSAKAFKDYTGKTRKLNIVRSNTALTLNSKSIGDNYVRMRIRILQANTPTKRNDGSTDGGWVRADVIADQDSEKVLAPNVRVFYLLDSKPGDVLRNAEEDDEVKILGMPRLDLDAILQASETQHTLTMQLPIEFVAVALLSSP